MLFIAYLEFFYCFVPNYTKYISY